jgi:hypothetical protein
VVDWNIEEMDALIKRLRQLAEELKQKSGRIQKDNDFL